MSLRSFHVVFVVASIALTLMMAVWGGINYGTDGGSVWHLVTMVGALLTGGLLVVYAVKFVRKTRELGLS